MTALIKVASPATIDVDQLIRMGQLSAAYKYDAQAFLDSMREQGRQLLDPEGWAAYQDKIGGVVNGKRYEAASFNKKLQAAKRVLRFVWQALGDHDATSQERFELALGVFKSRKHQRPAIQPVSEEEAQAMIRCALEATWGKHRNQPRPDLALMIEFLFKTGCRVSELCNILLTDIKALDREHYKLQVLGKGSKQRQIVATKELVQRIRAHFRSRLYLFESHKNNARADGRYSRSCVSHLVHDCAIKALGRGFGAHNLRHSFATLYYDSTKDLYGLQKLLGHSDVKITASTYVHGRLDYAKVTSIFHF